MSLPLAYAQNSLQAAFRGLRALLINLGSAAAQHIQ